MKVTNFGEGMETFYISIEAETAKEATELFRAASSFKKRTAMLDTLFIEGSAPILEIYFHKKEAFKEEIP